MTVLNSHTMDVDPRDAMIAELQAKLAAAKRAGQGRLTPKVSAKGAVSVYGFGKWPVTLYAGQWERLFEAVPQLQAFIAANRSELAAKPAAED
jgi:hypothetical protein